MVLNSFNFKQVCGSFQINLKTRKWRDNQGANVTISSIHSDFSIITTKRQSWPCSKIEELSRLVQENRGKDHLHGDHRGHQKVELWKKARIQCEMMPRLQGGGGVDVPEVPADSLDSKPLSFPSRG